MWRRLAEASRPESKNAMKDAVQVSGEDSVEQSSSKIQTKKLPRPNVLMAVPTIYSKMLEAADHNVLEPSVVADAAKTLSDMRLMISGSAGECPRILFFPYDMLIGLCKITN